VREDPAALYLRRLFIIETPRTWAWQIDAALVLGGRW
jgi:hypothetical protein